jgi:hypothetical protein
MNSIVVIKIFDSLTQHKQGRFNTIFTKFISDGSYECLREILRNIDRNISPIIGGINFNGPLNFSRLIWVLLEKRQYSLIDTRWVYIVQC